MLTREEFIRFRDEYALNRYRRELPGMRERLKRISEQCRTLMAEYQKHKAISDKHTADAFYNNECLEVFREWAELSAEIGEIQRDIPRRLANLKALEGQPGATPSPVTNRPSGKLF